MAWEGRLRRKLERRGRQLFRVQEESSNGEEKTRYPGPEYSIVTEDLKPAQRQAHSHKQGGLKGVPVKPFCESYFFTLILQWDILDK